MNKRHFHNPQSPLAARLAGFGVSAAGAAGYANVSAANKGKKEKVYGRQ